MLPLPVGGAIDVGAGVLNCCAIAATVGVGAPPDSSAPVARMFIAFIARSARPDSNSVTVDAYKLMSVPSFNL
jgi:hypothetical protein